LHDSLKAFKTLSFTLEDWCKPYALRSRFSTNNFGIEDSGTCDVTVSRLVRNSRRFEGAYCLHC